MRKYGLTIDKLLSVDLVTADGEFVTASETENADLFWGVRGGGGNFGIVTEFEFRLNPLGPEVIAGPIFWPMEQAAKVLRFYRDWIADVPGRADDDGRAPQGAAAAVRPAPSCTASPSSPSSACYAGPVEDGERVVRPLQGVRLAGARPVRAQALRRPSGDVRPLVPARLVVLLPVLRRRRR